MELTAAQVIIVGIVASLITVVANFLAARMGKELGKGQLSFVCAGVSFILAVVFQLPSLPAFVDPMQYVGEWVKLLSAYVGFATLIYNILIDQILKKAKLGAERFLNR
jgi:hypothetical protein